LDLLLIQERSGHVLTGAGQLALIRRAFHQRLADCTEDSVISITLERVQEELLGRPEPEPMASGSYVDPRHSTRRSPPMRRFVERRRDSYWTIGIAVTFETQLDGSSRLIPVVDGWPEA